LAANNAHDIRSRSRCSNRVIAHRTSRVLRLMILEHFTCDCFGQWRMYAQASIMQRIVQVRVTDAVKYAWVGVSTWHTEPGNLH